MKHIKKIFLWSALVLATLNGTLSSMERIRAITNPGRVIPTQEQITNAKICPICRSDFEAGHNLEALACNPATPHIFHTQCLKSWVKLGHLTCPLCRVKIQQSLKEYVSSHGPRLLKNATIGIVTFSFLSLASYYTDSAFRINFNLWNFAILAGAITSILSLDEPQSVAGQSILFMTVAALIYSSLFFLDIKLRTGR